MAHPLHMSAIDPKRTSRQVRKKTGGAVAPPGRKFKNENLLELIGDAYLANIQMGGRASCLRCDGAGDKVDIGGIKVRSAEANVVVFQLNRPIW